MVSWEDSWKEATEGLSEEVRDSWMSKFAEVYTDEKRTYHNIHFLCDKLTGYYTVKDKLKNPQAVLLALYFQK